MKASLIESQEDFANKWGVKQEHVSRWIKKGYKIEDDVLYRPVRRLKSDS